MLQCESSLLYQSTVLCSALLHHLIVEVSSQNFQVSIFLKQSYAMITTTEGTIKHLNLRLEVLNMPYVICDHLGHLTKHHWVVGGLLDF